MDNKESLANFLELIEQAEEGFLFFVKKDGHLKPIVLGQKVDGCFNFKTFFLLPEEELNAIKALFELFEKNYSLKEEQEIPKVILQILEIFAPEDKNNRKDVKIFPISSFKYKKTKGQ